MPSLLDKALSDFLKEQRGDQSYASLAVKLGVSESTIYRLINGEQSATLRGLENILKKLEVSLADIFVNELYRKRSRRD